MKINIPDKYNYFHLSFPLCQINNSKYEICIIKSLIIYTVFLGKYNTFH